MGFIVAYVTLWLHLYAFRRRMFQDELIVICKVSYKLIWTVIASLGVLTQIPGMIQAHSFNRCYEKRLEFQLSFYSEKPIGDERLKPETGAFNYCNGGEFH